MPSTEPELLLIDAGNSFLKVATLKGRRLLPLLRVPTEEFLKNPCLLKGISEGKELVVASVVPQVLKRIKELHPNPLIVSQKLKLPFKLRYGSEMGADRIANLAALHGERKPTVVVSCGTATVIDALINGAFAGGYLLPGIEKGAECLSEKTALLPKVKPEGTLKGGFNTKECLNGGLFLMTVGAIEKAKEIFKAKRVVVTGGWGKTVAELGGWEFDRYLTFKGMVEIWKVNC
jgi:type III pantothenate kinase